MVHPAAIAPPETAHELVSVPDDHFRATDVPPQLPPETVTGWVFVALVKATEFGLAVMNGVGVMVSVPRTPPPPAVQFRGTTVGAVAPGALTSSVRLSGAVVVNVASDTVTVPLAAAVSVPTWLPARITTGAAGKAAGEVNVPVTAMPKPAEAVAPVAVNGIVPENVTTVPGPANASMAAGTPTATPRPVSFPFRRSAAVVPGIAESGTSAVLAARLTAEPELTGLGDNTPSTTVVVKFTGMPAAEHVSPLAGVSAAATPAVRLLSAAADTTVMTLATGKAAMRTRSLRPRVDGFIVSSLLEPTTVFGHIARSPPDHSPER
jgi:hypothetical protein